MREQFRLWDVFGLFGLLLLLPLNLSLLLQPLHLRHLHPGLVLDPLLLLEIVYLTLEDLEKRQLSQDLSALLQLVLVQRRVLELHLVLVLEVRTESLDVCVSG